MGEKGCWESGKGKAKYIHIYLNPTSRKNHPAGSHKSVGDGCQKMGEIYLDPTFRQSTARGRLYCVGEMGRRWVLGIGEGERVEQRVKQSISTST